MTVAIQILELRALCPLSPVVHAVDLCLSELKRQATLWSNTESIYPHIAFSVSFAFDVEVSLEVSWQRRSATANRSTQRTCPVMMSSSPTGVLVDSLLPFDSR